MSFNLYFKRCETLTRKNFDAYFAGRAWYEADGDQVNYGNKDTGVYFGFDWKDGDIDSGEDKDREPHCASFEMNLCRPSVFGLEAELEVSAFVKHFGCTVVDPQHNGFAAAYSGEKFIASWNGSNAFGSRGLAQLREQQVAVTLPSAVLTSHWKWNVHRRSLGDSLGADVFVPKIMYFDDNGRARSMIVWTDGIPLATPRVEWVVLNRDKLAPRRLFSRQPGLVVTTWDEMQDSLLPLFTHKESEQEYWLLEYHTVNPPPRGVVEYFKRKKENDDAKLRDKGLALDQILDESLTLKAAA